jgi:hypothetical protein
MDRESVRRLNFSHGIAPRFRGFDVASPSDEIKKIQYRKKYRPDI